MEWLLQPVSRQQADEYHQAFFVSYKRFVSALNISCYKITVPDTAPFKRQATVPNPAPQHYNRHYITNIRHCKQHRTVKIQPQSSTTTGTVTVPVVW
ncbi:hypothetical protein DPU22_23665 [Salmonella enterica subsp. enterica serovar Newport]|uniref:Uncharacterized protein n=1 Tax=Salmonella enterica I TaxID=59201 RepID=A0A3V2NZK8_SALET|nr:hypothetical protein [Salmonella enterica subsp. enterica serovar Newport]EAZ1917538.1 hypothetical protein [Salmonella enterica]EBZ2217089.1 hypothetical protein [Salmonella enterica subsp. enterica serovar Montevideo]EDT6461782.1 hypothetical protein [Salmonella enterica subsp. enterica]EBR9097157.1 hypothetical protein [Salmonella enterica subsp. enterica serovar Newport]